MQIRIQSLSLIILVSLSINHIQAETFTQLIAEKKELPGLIIANKILPLPFFSITSLDDIDKIPNIEHARVILLAGNKIRRVKAGAFKSPKFKNLRVLDLGNNLIDEVEDGGFEGLDSVYALFLNDNRLRKLSRDSLKGMPQLRYISLGNNPGKEALYDQARHQVPTKTVVYTQRLTKKLTAQILGLAALAFGTYLAVMQIKGLVSKAPTTRPSVTPPADVPPVEPSASPTEQPQESTASDDMSSTPLQAIKEAIENNNRELAINLLLDIAPAININAQDAAGNTLLHLVAQKGDAWLPLVSILLNKDISTTIINNDQETAYSIAETKAPDIAKAIMARRVIKGKGAARFGK